MYKLNSDDILLFNQRPLEKSNIEKLRHSHPNIILKLLLTYTYIKNILTCTSLFIKNLFKILFIFKNFVKMLILARIKQKHKKLQIK